ncbi:MAG: carbohydrate binding family 9 domain-containing protein [Gemmatimonadetes bacterium]|nr:carbohydrate binding family 9 domain-containing protein [Gemmatimonadota bacterium]
MIVCLGVVVATPVSVFAQDSTSRVARTARIATPPQIDGRLDDPVWREARPITDFIQRDPSEGAPATERTEVRLLSDGKALYIGAWMFDRDPAGIVAGERIRDVTLSNSDYFSVIFDTYHDRQNGFVFATTPAGVEHDGQVVKEGEGGGVFQQGQTRAQAGSAGGFNLNWDASWTVRTHVDSLGWYAEFRIPFSTLRYGGAREQTWGLNFARSIRRRNEESLWAPVERQHNLYRLSRAGTLVELAVPSQRIATVTPYILSSAQKLYSPLTVTLPWDSTRYPTEFGVDAKLGITPSLTLDATYNTDFAQVEVDEQRTNLTRFPLFFPEKRPFFLENAGVFSSGTPQAVELFFSRRIGIDSEGNPVPIVGGGRLTGRVAGLTVGGMQLFTEKAQRQPANSYSVARVSREWGRSRLGLMGVHRVATSDGDDRNSTIGLDGRFALSEPFTFDWWAAKTATPGLDGRDGAFSGRLEYRTRRWNNVFRYTQVGEDFNPEVGFLSRSGYRYYEGSIFHTMPLNHSRLRYWLPHVNYRGFFGFDGKIQSEMIHLDAGEMEFANGGRIGPEINVFREGLTSPFAIARGVTLPAGEYRWTNLAFDFSTNPSAPLSFTTRLEAGPFYNGTRYGGSATLTVRQGSSLTSSLLLDYNDVNLDEGEFVRSLVGVRIGYFFTPRIFTQSLVQYNNQARVFSANIRFGWLNTAGTGLFVVLNLAENATGLFAWDRSITRSFVVKFTRQFGTGG